MHKSLNRVTIAVLACFMIVALSSAYWGAIAADSMLVQDFNPRLVDYERSIFRGAIYDREGELLAESVQTGVSPAGMPVMQRSYPHPEAAGAVGYYSLRYGVGGVEAAFDEVLRGDDQLDAGERAMNTILHRQQVGYDVRTTLDLSLQQSLVRAFGAQSGAAVVIDVPSGAVLAMVSLPSFDPNTLDANYPIFREEPSAPLLNRVTQGIYQPGGALQTVILASMLTEGVSFDQLSETALAPMRVNGLTLACANPPDTPITLREAYQRACPAPFAEYTAEQPTSVQTMIDAFGLGAAPDLEHFGTVAGRAAPPLLASSGEGFLRRQGAGQGALTVTPLQMVLVAATIANNGNVITPYLVDAIRPPGGDWQPFPPPDISRAVTTGEVAAQIREAMRFPDPNTGDFGHASIAYTGAAGNVWFIGFAEKPDGGMIAVAVVIEGTTEVDAAVQIGTLALH